MNDDTPTAAVTAEGGTPPLPDGHDVRAEAAQAAAPAVAEPAPAPVAATPAPAAAPVDLDAVRAEARGAAATEVGQIAELCTLAGMPDRAAAMIARGLSAEEARRELLGLRAAAEPALQSHLLPGAGTAGNLDDNPVVRAATARAAQAKEA